MKKSYLFVLCTLFFHCALMAQNIGPKIEFKETYHDFGDIKQGEVVEHKFEFTNTGDSILVLQKVYSTCGCTIPTWPKEGIAPGQTEAIVVKYNSEGKMGLQNKIITIFSNVGNEADAIPQRVSIRVNVLPKK